MLHSQKYEMSHGRMCGESFGWFHTKIVHWRYFNCTIKGKHDVRVYDSGHRLICHKCGCVVFLTKGLDEQ